jgi:DNA-binding PadR family transcriptional regulator
MRRGEIRPLILAALATKPMHGYEVIQALESNSGGRWRPSAGSVYPTLQQLSDEGLVSSAEIDGRRVYTLTDTGRQASAASPTLRSWSDGAADGSANLPDAVKALLGATMQVQRMGTPQARQETLRILTNARRQVYRLLADDEDPPPSAPDSEG